MSDYHLCIDLLKNKKDEQFKIRQCSNDIYKNIDSSIRHSIIDFSFHDPLAELNKMKIIKINLKIKTLIDLILLSKKNIATDDIFKKVHNICFPDPFIDNSKKELNFYSGIYYYLKGLDQYEFEIPFNFVHRYYYDFYTKKYKNIFTKKIIKLYQLGFNIISINFYQYQNMTDQKDIYGFKSSMEDFIKLQKRLFEELTINDFAYEDKKETYIKYIFLNNEFIIENNKFLLNNSERKNELIFMLKYDVNLSFDDIEHINKTL
jgi:hypothetical protein